MTDYKLLIDGKLVPGDLTMPVINPATGESFAESPRASKEQLETAIQAAHRAFQTWSKTSLEARRQILLKIADAAEANVDRLARILTQEQGKPLAHSKGEVFGLAAFFRHATTLDLPVTIIKDTPQRRIELHRRPLGVCAAIIPWNAPLIIAAFKMPIALLAGNTLIIKPAPTTPLATLLLGEIIADIVPPGVVNIIADANDLGAIISSHPLIRKVSFTGSTPTGRRVMASAAATLKRLTLELGGNDAGIVLDDVDPKKVAPELFRVAFQNSGQICAAVKRLYVHEKIYDAICDELVKLANAAIVGDGLEQGTELGPVQNKAQFDIVKDLIEDAKSHGTIIAGGVQDRPGYFIRPTLVRDITDGTRLVDEEQFGPVLPIIKFTDPEDALRRANSAAVGLSGSVWSSDIDRAYELASRMEVGTSWVNNHAELDPSVPFGGAKDSGMGVEFSDEGLAEYTQLQVVSVAK